MIQIPTPEEQAAAWDAWNAAKQKQELSEISIDQRETVVRWLKGQHRNNLDLIEVGCGVGWLCPTLTTFGRVTATDLSTAMLAQARGHAPDVSFVAGDFMSLNFDDEAYDVAVSLEVLAHVPNQGAFIEKLARILRPNGVLMLATQNRPVLQRLNRTKPLIAGQIRRWVDRAELTALLVPHFDVLEVSAITPRTNRMPWRLVNNSKLNPVLERFFGNAPKRWKERLGWGWTLMALARKRG
jgi:2-polyprenyl-3-methyl-5-hydroxy-6-metoxy-1,4-benzoquinol methylase